MQTILGAGGDIGQPLAKELKNYTDKIRLVARQPKQVNGDDELFSANLLDTAKTHLAIAGSEVVYLTVGLPYDSRIWKKDWPLIMSNVISGCVQHGSKLVFLDNVYMYDSAAIPNMTEDSKRNPPSRKGKVRLQIEQMITEAIQHQGLKAIIAKSADFYGPDAKNGILNTLVLTPLMKGKKPNWQMDANRTHSFTYTPDAAKALAILGNTDKAYGEVWHLPTSPQRYTGKQLIQLAADIKGVQSSYFVLGKFLLRIAGLFNRTIHELVEMQYQNEQDYFFNSEKFCREFDFRPTSYEEGIKTVLRS